MGTMVGHMVPGAFFLIIGLWWTFNIWGNYFRALQNRRRFESSVSFPLRQGSRVPWESIFVIICATAAIVGQHVLLVLFSQVFSALMSMAYVVWFPDDKIALFS